MNLPTESPTLRAMIGAELTYRPTAEPYDPAQDQEAGRLVVGNGMTVTVREVFEDWNAVPGLTVFYVYVPATGLHTHLSAGELELDLEAAR